MSSKTINYLIKTTNCVKNRICEKHNSKQNMQSIVIVSSGGTENIKQIKKYKYKISPTHFVWVFFFNIVALSVFSLYNKQISEAFTKVCMSAAPSNKGQSRKLTLQ